jgi:quercetin 2,3-dioxygenase
MKLIKSNDRYLTQRGWLKSYHSFSFGEHYHPENRGWGNLRVINEDYIAAGGHFDTHPHRDMEIVSYLVKGKLHHKDSAGNEYIIHPGDVQRISAGSGILHSETNSSESQETHLMQLWVKPNVKQTEPDYAQVSFNPKDKINRLQLLASESGREESITIKQDVDIYASILDQNRSLKIEISKDKAWLQLISGYLKVNNIELEPGDALAIEEQQELLLNSLKEGSHFLFFNIGG